MEYVIETKELCKQYGDSLRVNHVNLKIPRGCVYGFLGPNGAGKSTTMKLILGLTRPTKGTITILGKNFTEQNRLEILRKTGSLIESPSFYSHLSGYENLDIVTELKKAQKKEIEEVLAIVRLTNQKDKKVGQYSLGMKQRLGIAAALIGRPSLLLLDEPTNGLDPAGIQEIRELLMELPDRYEMTVLISSHLLSEIDQMVTSVGIIDNGELIYQDTLESLHDMGRSKMIIRTLDNEAAYEKLKRHGIACELAKERITLLSMEAGQLANEVSRLVQEGVGIFRIEEEKKTLEDIFLNLTGRKVSL